jgi:hypothetical protein
MPPRPTSALWKAGRRGTKHRSKAQIQADWIARNAAIIYHRRYIVPRTDFDSDGQPIWARAVTAANAIRTSDFVRLQLISLADVLVLLPQRLWATAETLAQVGRLRSLQREILRDAGSVSDQVIAEVTGRQVRSMESVMRHVNEQVSQLEHLASVLEQADAASRQWAMVHRLTSLDEIVLNPLGNAADINSDVYPAERIEVQEVIDQISEAVRSLDATEP